MDAHDPSGDDGEWGHCSVCGEEKPRSQLVRAEAVRPSLASRIEADHPTWGGGDSICLDDLHQYRLALIRDQLTADQTDELSGGEETVLGSLSTNEIVAEDVEAEFRGRLTIGDRLADGLSEFAGSWTLIVIFAEVYDKGHSTTICIIKTLKIYIF